MAIQEKIPVLQSSAIASYDYQDIADGTGIEIFYGCFLELNTEQGETPSYTSILTSENSFIPKLIVNTVFRSALGLTTSYSIYAGYEKTFNLTAFNSPRIIRGRALIQNCFCARLTTGASNTTRTKIKYTLQKNGVEIASAFSEYLEASADVYGSPKLVSVYIDVPQTNFKRGDVLSLKMEAWGKYVVSPGSDTYLKFGADTLNRDDPAGDITPSTEVQETTQLKVYIPFKINIT